MEAALLSHKSYYSKASPHMRVDICKELALGRGPRACREGAPCAMADAVDDLGRQVLLCAHKGVGARIWDCHDGDLLLRRDCSGLPGLRRVSCIQHPHQSSPMTGKECRLNLSLKYCCLTLAYAGTCCRDAAEASMAAHAVHRMGHPDTLKTQQPSQACAVHGPGSQHTSSLMLTGLLDEIFKLPLLQY